MNKMPFDRPSNSEDELLPEYQFDYKKAKLNRFANRSGKPKLTVVVLDEDVAEVFSTPESVNKVLRAFIEVMPQASSGEKDKINDDKVSLFGKAKWEVSKLQFKRQLRDVVGVVSQFRGVTGV